MTLDEALELLTPVAQALAVAHRHKVAHRDVKPENVFVSDVEGRRTVKILDFGIAKVLTHHANFASVGTQRTPSAFTPSYGAPEQFNKKRGATGPWTDVFALALLFVELVTGERALEGDDATQLYIASADPASRPTPRHHGFELGDAVEDVLGTALAVEPRERFGDAAAFWQALEEAAGRKTAEAAAAPLAVDVSETGEFASRTGLDLESAPTEADVSHAREDAPSPSSSEQGSTALLTRARASEVEDSRTTPPEATAASTPVASSTGSSIGQAEPSAARARHARPASASKSGLPLLPFMIGLCLAGAGALYWQLTSIGPSVEPRRPAPRPSASARPTTVRSSATASATVSVTASATALASAVGSAGQGGEGGAPPSAEPPEGMVRLALPDGKRAFFLDKTEVTARAFLECVTAGRCKKASRVVLTDESARALGLAVDDSAGPDQVAAAWEKRCNAGRGAGDHPANCVGWASAEDYCTFRSKRLPTSSEWTVAATRGRSVRHPWGDAAPDCRSACFGRNGACLPSSSEVQTCSVGTHPRDASPDGLVDLLGNVAEWVVDEAPQASGEGLKYRLVRGGGFLDEADALDLGKVRALPPITAWVSLGFRCALDAP
jgi:serine/threonine-protein kinase